MVPREDLPRAVTWGSTVQALAFASGPAIAGNTASRDPRFAPMYARLRASGANHARAVRGVADRLLGVLIGMLRTQTLYQPPATTT